MGKDSLRKNYNNKWSLEEYEYLRNNYKTKSLEQLSLHLGKSTQSIHMKIYFIENKKENMWSYEEIEFLKNNYGVITLEEIAIALNRTISSVTSKKEKLHLVLTSESPLVKNKPSKQKWTDKEIKFLKNNCDKLSKKELSIKMSRSIHAIEQKERSLRNYHKSFKWTSQDDNTLESLWGEKSKKYIAKKLGRTERAVSHRALKLNLGSIKASDSLSCRDIAQMLNRDRTTVAKWIKKGLLKSNTIQNAHSITYKNLFEFLEKNQELWDSTNLPKNLLGSTEDKWLIEKRKKDIFNNVQNNKKKWSLEEEKILVKLVRQGVSNIRISKILKRSENSISKKKCQLYRENKLWDNNFILDKNKLIIT